MHITKFEVRVGEHIGNLTLAIPYASLDPIREQLKDLMAISSSENSWSSFIEQQALFLGNTVTARSGMFHLTIKDILALKTGQILDPGYNPNQPLTVLVGGKPKFKALPGERGGKKAINITEIIHA
jgi:flagellar motor switch protein FliM